MIRISSRSTQYKLAKFVQDIFLKISSEYEKRGLAPLKNQRNQPLMLTSVVRIHQVGVLHL